MISDTWEYAKRLALIDDSLNRLESSTRGTAEELAAMSNEIQDLEIRIVRLETARENDRAQMAAEFERFAWSVWRFGFNFLPLTITDNR